MNQQEKLKICAEALGFTYVSGTLEGSIQLAINNTSCRFPADKFIYDLETTFDIATWQDSEGVWFAAKDVSARSITTKSVILDYPEFFSTKTEPKQSLIAWRENRNE